MLIDKGYYIKHITFIIFIHFFYILLYITNTITIIRCCIMLTKIKNILLWPFKVDDVSFSKKGFKTCFISIIFLAAALFSLYKAGTYYYDIYYLPIDAEQAVNDYFIQDEAKILKYSYNAGFPFVSAAVNLHFNSIKEKPQIVTIIEPDLPADETEVDRANKLFNEIGIGSAEYNNGVLIYVTGIYDSAFKIEVGYGLEDVITDSKAGMILDNAFSKIGGKENLSDDNLNEVLLYIFTDIANIIAAKYNVNISEDLKQQSFYNITYYEPLDDLGLFLKYYMIVVCCIIILLIFSKRYIAMIIFLPLFIITVIELFFATGIFTIVAFVFFPVVLSIYMSESNYKPDKKNKKKNIKDKENQIDSAGEKNQDEKLNQENISQDNTLLESSETVNPVKENDVIENIDKDNTQNSVRRNLLSVIFIPQKNKLDFLNMAYQFLLFYSALFFTIYFIILWAISFIDYESIYKEIIKPEELSVDNKLKMYTNVDGLAGYYKAEDNTYILDDSFSKELYGINYLFQQSEYKPEIAAYFIKEDTEVKSVSLEKLYSYYQLDKLENQNGLLIVFYYNQDDNTSRIEMKAGDGLKSVLSEYDMEEIKIIALEHTYHGETLYMDSDFTIKEPEDYTKKVFMNTIKKGEQTFGKESEIDAEQQAQMLTNVIRLANKNNEFSRINMIMTYKERGNCVKVLQEAVEQSAYIIAEAYKINIDDEKLLTYYNTIPAYVDVSQHSLYSLIKFIILIVVFLVILIVTIYIRYIRKVSLYGLALAVALVIALDINSTITAILSLSILALIFITGIISLILGKGGSSGGGRFRSRRSRSGGSGFGGFSRGRSGRSFRGGGRSGGGGAFRR